MMTRNSMRCNMVTAVTLACFVIFGGNLACSEYNEETGKEYLKKINKDIQKKTTESVIASWGYESNITDENLAQQLKVSAELANMTKKIWEETIKFPWKTFKDPDVRRQFQKFSVLGTAILSPEKYEKFNKIVSDMQSIYGKAKICEYNDRSNCTLQLEPDLTEIFAKSRDPDELRYYWEEWRNAAGRPVRELYEEYVELSNEAAVLNNFTDSAQFWLKDYEADDFKEQVQNLWQQLKPLYLQLHAYVRGRLRNVYGESHVTKRGPIPAHLLGNMWAQGWGNIFDITAPYPEKTSIDVSAAMVEQGYTPLQMFKLAEEFFTSLGLSPMPDTFWKNSILEKPTDGRDLICHASAWDFYDGKDFRIKQCTRITMEDLNTVHHEMGHIQYYLQYKNQPLVYKEGSNPGFHEAVGDVMALSVSTPKHLKKIGLFNTSVDDEKSDINQLYSMALEKIAFLPFGYLMDQWRWSVFEKKTTPEDYNCVWWKLREEYQGLSPATIRTEADFDPGAKYHTVGNVPYIRYFVSFVIQFQFHRSLCIAANEYDPNEPFMKPLHKCDIYQSKEAGNLLKSMLEMGSSKPWPDAMEVITGQRKMDARPLLEYFSTLQAWLEKENKKNNEYIGWETSAEECKWKERNAGRLANIDGNSMGKNIAYSLAEFVRQDDNYFVASDYDEEVEPSYHELLHKLKKNKFKGDCSAPVKFRKHNGVLLLEKTNDNGNEVNGLFSKSEKNSGQECKKQGIAEYMGQGTADCMGQGKAEYAGQGSAGCVGQGSMGCAGQNCMCVKEVFKIQSKKDYFQKAKIMRIFMEKKYRQAIKNQCKQQEEKKSKNKKCNKYVKFHETQSNLRSEQKTEPGIESLVNPKSKKKENIIQRKKFTSQKLSQNGEQNSESNDVNANNMMLHGHKFMKENLRGYASYKNLKKEANFDRKLHRSKQLVKDTSRNMKLLKSGGNMDLRDFSSSSNDREKIISRDLLKNFEDTSSNKFVMPSNSRRSNTFHDSAFPKRSISRYETFPNVLSLSDVNEKNNYISSTSFGYLPKHKKRRSTCLRNHANNKNARPFVEYNLVDVIPVDQLSNDLPENNTPKAKSARCSLDTTENDRSSYLMLVGKLADKVEDKEKKYSKKSYQYYYYDLRTPVLYNSVIITNRGRPSDESHSTRAR